MLLKATYLGFLLLLSSSCQAAKRELPEQVTQIIYDWAPLIWLHPEEVFFPSSVDFHFENIEVRDSNEVVIQSGVDRFNIVTGDDTHSYHLNTVPDLPCPDCVLDFFEGENINEMQVPTYVFVKEYNDPCNTIDVVYRSFYPYNFGKDVCIGIEHNETRIEECLGVWQSFGNHVADWEHFSIRIRDLKVIEAYVSVHSWGAKYLWNDTTNNFQFLEGEESSSKIDVIQIDYPQTIEIVDGTHPEVFSANGSHGLWSAPGVHEYVNFVIHLRDHVDRGHAWKTWEDLEITTYSPDIEFEGSLHYLGYRGRYGNLKQGCGIVETVTGECILVDAPGLSIWPGDFPDDCSV